MQGALKRLRPESPAAGDAADYDDQTPQVRTVNQVLSYKVITASSLSCLPPNRQNVDFSTIKDSDVVVGREPRGPTIRFAPSIKEQLVRPWRNALIVKLLGVRHTYNYFNMKLRQKWSMLKGHWTVLDIANDYCIVNFDSEADRNQVLTEGPWIITGRYLAIRKWEPGFCTSDGSISKLTVWVRISALHVEWFNFQVLTRIGTLLGATHKVDLRSVTHSRGQYARICVELDLTKPLKTTIKVDDIWYQIQYEGFHLVCFSCGIYGHDKDSCPRLHPCPSPSQQVNMESTSSTTKLPTQQFTAQSNTMRDDTQAFGQWNLVLPRNPRKGLTTNTVTASHTTKQSGSRFNVLQADEECAFNAMPDSSPLPNTRQIIPRNKKAVAKGTDSGSSRRPPRQNNDSKSSRIEKGKSIMRSYSGPRVCTNAMNIQDSVSMHGKQGDKLTEEVQLRHATESFPIPKVFAFNVAQDIPSAVLDSRPSIQPDPPDLIDSAMKELESDPPDMQLQKGSNSMVEDALLGSSIEEAGNIPPPLISS